MRSYPSQLGDVFTEVKGLVEEAFQALAGRLVEITLQGFLFRLPSKDFHFRTKIGTLYRG